MTTKPITGKYVFCWLAGFFAVIIAVNATMATLALTTFNGLTSDTAYVDGLSYNDTLAAIEAQKARGWIVQTGIERPGDQQVIVTASYEDAAGRPINRLDVTAEFVRPVMQGSDFAVPLTQSGAGLYRVTAGVPLAGQWDIHIVARQPGQAPYVLTRRSVIR